jgi:hypothetical protein
MHGMQLTSAAGGEICDHDGLGVLPQRNAFTIRAVWCRDGVLVGIVAAIRVAEEVDGVGGMNGGHKSQNSGRDQREHVELIW